ncbi:MAG: hypothetical protein IT292_00610 [Deltaproteobacteria bacterium]|nr:hypothetical protein [Deltaproteobacteria bacterium]
MENLVHTFATGNEELSLLQATQREYSRLLSFHCVAPGMLNEDRYNKAAELWAALNSGSAFDNCHSNAEKRKVFYELLVLLRVDIENAYSPEIDPNIGWLSCERVFCEPLADDIMISTQLCDYSLRETYQGAISSIIYKPRRCELAGYGENIIERLWFYPILIDAGDSLGPARSELITSSPDRISLRFIGSLLEHNSANYYSEYHFKSGLGSYLNNATTGFNCSFWLNEECAALTPLLYLDSFICLPSGTLQGVSVQPLMAAGSDVSATQDIIGKRSFNEPSNCYGVRLFDGLNSFVLDIRFAKAVHSIEIYPSSKATDNIDSCIGLKLRVALKTLEIIGQDNCNSVYVSFS